MKQKPDLKVLSSRYLKHMLMDLKLLILVVLLGSSGVLQGADQQQRVVTGTVTDAASGALMPGVNIIVRGTTIGVLTDNNGKYSIAVPDASNAVLGFSFIGYNAMDVAVSGSSVVNAALVPSTTALDEVIVIGYGTQKKSDLTGSVTRVTMEDKATLANSNLSQAMSGSTAGVNVLGVGLAGGDPSLSIRGQTSLSASDAPLIVLDGIIYNGSITNINVNDIESVDILKDASAAAVYGSRSANGVMLITTKKGKSEKPLISFNMHYGFQDMTNNPMRVMNAQEYAVRLVDYYYQQDLYTWYKTNPTSEAGRPVRPDITNRDLVAARLRTQEERDNYLAGNEIDWVDEVLRTAPIQNYHLSMSGKSDKSNYFVSASYTDEQGIQLNDEFGRITLHSNVESKVTDWLTVGLNSSYSFRDYSGIEANLGAARACSPLANNKIGLPNYDMYLTGEAYMPYPLVNNYADHVDTRNDLLLVGNAKITVPWITGLTYEFNYSNNLYSRKYNRFYPSTTPDGAGNKGQAIKNPSEERNWIYNNIVTYLRTFGNHQVNATLLYSQEGRDAESSNLNAQGFDNPVLGYNNVGLGTTVTVASTAWKENSISYMARASYSFRSRYLLTATIRRDGFSGFGENKKFANFPSVSVGWVASDESFLSAVSGLYLKLRASYGKNGNQGIGRYSSFSRMTADSYVFGPTTAIAVYPSSLGNADLGWETTASFNLGTDFGLFNRRISGSIDVYKAQTTDVLVNRALPPTTGYPSVWTNIGAIDNKGIEFELTSVNLTGKLGWETNFVFSLNRDKITKLYGDENDKDVGNSWFVGEPISAIYDYEMAGGLWTEAELYAGQTYTNWYPGQYKYVDQNSDGIIEANNDRKIIGYRTPSYRFSINNTLSYQNFAFSFFINSIQGGKNYFLQDNAPVVNVAWRSDDVLRINTSAVRPYWTPDNGVNNATGVYNSPAVSSGIYESRSFVRLQDISLSYRFSPQILKSMNFQSAQIFVSSKNPYTWTKWSGWDPETFRTNAQNSPLMRNVTAGFRVTF
jgi:TonB-dependent starch-binding outer membrane protein SusC